MTRDRPGVQTEKGESGAEFESDLTTRRTPKLVKQKSGIDMEINGSVINNYQYQGRYAVDYVFMFPNFITADTTSTNATTSFSLSLSPGIAGFQWNNRGYFLFFSANSPGTTTSFSAVVSISNYGSWPQNAYKGSIENYYLYVYDGGRFLSNNTLRFTIPISMTATESFTTYLNGFDLAPFPFGLPPSGYRQELLPTFSPTSLNWSGYLTNINTTFSAVRLFGSFGYGSFNTLGLITE